MFRTSWLDLQVTEGQRGYTNDYRLVPKESQGTDLTRASSHSRRRAWVDAYIIQTAWLKQKDEYYRALYHGSFAEYIVWGTARRRGRRVCYMSFCLGKHGGVPHVWTFGKVAVNSDKKTKIVSGRCGTSCQRLEAYRERADPAGVGVLEYGTWLRPFTQCRTKVR